MHLDDLSNQTPLAYTYNIRHVRITHTGCDDKRSCYFFNRTFTTHFFARISFLTYAA